MEQNVLEIKNLCKKYFFGNASKDKKHIKALDDFSAVLTPGIYALLGQNGAGKSTLIKYYYKEYKRRYRQDFVQWKRYNFFRQRILKYFRIYATTASFL